MIKRIVISFFVVLFLASCATESNNKYLSYKNIVILSDLSSRIDNKPSKDIDEINRIVKYFRNECVRPGKKMGDRSSIAFSTFSDKVAAKVDLSSIKGIGALQKYINSTEEYTGNGFDKKLEEFLDKVNSVYSTVRNPGLDLISQLVEKLENESVVKQDTFVTDGVDTTFLSYDNHVYILTDGYLEYLNKNRNRQFYFGEKEIEAVRAYCKTHNVEVAKALEDNPGLGLPPYKRKTNQYVTLHVSQTHERDKDEKLQTYRNPVGLRDNEILEAVWRKWANESGFKELNWKKY